MLVFLATEDLGVATRLVLDVIRTEQPMRNSMTSAVVAVRESPHEPYQVVHPPDHQGHLHLP